MDRAWNLWDRHVQECAGRFREGLLWEVPKRVRAVGGGFVRWCEAVMKRRLSAVMVRKLCTSHAICVRRQVLHSLCTLVRVQRRRRLLCGWLPAKKMRRMLNAAFRELILGRNTGLQVRKLQARHAQAFLKVISRTWGRYVARMRETEGRLSAKCSKELSVLVHMWRGFSAHAVRESLVCLQFQDRKERARAKVTFCSWIGAARLGKRGQRVVVFARARARAHAFSCWRYETEKGAECGRIRREWERAGREWEREREGLSCERDKLREGLAALQDALKISTSVNRCVHVSW